MNSFPTVEYERARSPRRAEFFMMGSRAPFGDESRACPSAATSRAPSCIRLDVNPITAPTNASPIQNTIAAEQRTETPFLDQLLELDSDDLFLQLSSDISPHDVASPSPLNSPITNAMPPTNDLGVTELGRPLIASGGFISDACDLNDFRDNWFDPGDAMPRTQDGPAPGGPPRRRRPSHGGTTVTSNSQQAKDCYCPVQGCETRRAYVSHIINHLIQKHRFHRKYLKSVLNTTTKHKKECVIVHHDWGCGICTWCWVVLSSRDHVDEHVNQSSQCTNHQNWAKEKKLKIMVQMMRSYESSQDVGSEASRSFGGSITVSTDLEYIGNHLSETRSTMQTPDSIFQQEFEWPPLDDPGPFWAGGAFPAVEPGLSSAHPLPIPRILITSVSEWNSDSRDEGRNIMSPYGG